MKNFKKMMLLPYNDDQIGGEFTSFTKKDEEISKLKTIDTNMDNLLKKDELPTDVKLVLYNRLLSTFNEILTELRGNKIKKPDSETLDNIPDDTASKTRKINLYDITRSLNYRIRPRAKEIGKILKDNFEIDQNGLLISNDGEIINTTPAEFLQKTSLRRPKITGEVNKVLDILEAKTPDRFDSIFKSKTSPDISSDIVSTPKNHVFGRNLKTIKSKDLKIKNEGKEYDDDVIKGISKY